MMNATADMGGLAAVADMGTTTGAVLAEGNATQNGMTREAYVAAVREIAAAFVGGDAAQRVLAAKLIYGVGSMRGARGLCYYGAWRKGESAAVEVIEVCAQAEESMTQLAGTTIHECAHVIAGPGAGHGPEWKAAAKRLGLEVVEAAGQSYAPEHFSEAIRAEISALPVPTDGAPAFGLGSSLPVARPKPCPLGIGTRGGKSRGTGSGSRLRLHVCGCGVKVRVARDIFNAKCIDCGTLFERKA